MVKKEELHVLIRSLTKSEKRYFQLFCSRESSGNNYLKLFEAIDKQLRYNQNEIKRQFENEKFILQLHVTKNYLRKLILKSLRNFHANISKDAELKDILRNVEILYHKELYVNCESELKRANTMAQKFELFVGIVEIETWNRKLKQAMFPQDYNSFKTTLIRQKEAISVLVNSNSYWQLAVSTSTSIFNENKKTENLPSLLKKPDLALTLESKVLFYNTRSLFFIQNKDGKAERELRTLIKLLDKHPQRMSQEPGLYVSSVNNLVSYLVFNKEYKEALKLIEKAKRKYEGWKITSENKILLKQILRTYNVELEIYRDTKLFREKSEFIESTEAFVKTTTYKMPKEYLLSFWFQLASIHFMQGNYTRSLTWINLLLNARFKDVRTDLQGQAHILNLIVHLEQQNLMVLRYYVDSARRYLKKVKQIEPFEKILLTFFIKVARLPLFEYKKAFIELKFKLFSDEEPLIPKNMLGYIDYLEWIDGKIK